MVDEVCKIEAESKAEEERLENEKKKKQAEDHEKSLENQLEIARKKLREAEDKLTMATGNNIDQEKIEIEKMEIEKMRKELNTLKEKKESINKNETQTEIPDELNSCIKNILQRNDYLRKMFLDLYKNNKDTLPTLNEDWKTHITNEECPN